MFGRGKREIEGSKLGEILVRMGAITTSQLARVVEEKDDRLLGSQLVERGLVTKEELEQALCYQDQMRSGRRLEAMLTLVEKRTALHVARLAHAKG